MELPREWPDSTPRIGHDLRKSSGNRCSGSEKTKKNTPKTNGGEKGHSEKWTEKLKEQFGCPFLRTVLPDHLPQPLPDWVNLVLPGCPGSLVAKSCPTLVTPGTVARQTFSVDGILQARILEWVAVSSSRGSSLPDPGIVLGRKPVKPKVPQTHHSSPLGIPQTPLAFPVHRLTLFWGWPCTVFTQQERVLRGHSRGDTPTKSGTEKGLGLREPLS